MDEARDYHLMPERRPLLQSFKTKPRRCKDLAGVIYAVGGQTKSGNSLSTVEVSLHATLGWFITSVEDTKSMGHIWPGKIESLEAVRGQRSIAT